MVGVGVVFGSNQMNKPAQSLKPTLGPFEGSEPVPVTPRQAARHVTLANARESMRALRILVMEDNAIIGMLLAEVLEEMGHDVYAIEATEDAAVTAAFRCRPDLMIVDAQLGDGSGISAVEEIVRTGFVPHVFVSGDILGVMALRPGAVVIEKPFSESDLALAIRHALDTVAAS
jgi:two-component system, response regulator PdtaR